MIPYNPLDWYWIVGGGGPHLPDEEAAFPPAEQVFSSARGGYVPATDETYLAWVESNPEYDPTTRIDTEENLAAVLEPYGIGVTLPLATV